MREEVIKNYLLGKVLARELKNDLKDSVQREGVVSRFKIEDMKEDFLVKPEHLIRLCDDFFESNLGTEEIEQVAFCLEASDFFYWDGDTTEGACVGDILNWFCSPEINYKLDADNFKKFREYLTTLNCPF